MHIKFLDHGKGDPSKASAYLLDELDHLGNVRAGIDVLRGDAITFNAIADSSPHLWKYTSGVIAWSKDDAPTDEQIHEVLNEFEAHAFAGLEQSQYHLFAVQHTDDDGSKHIHVLVPRLDLHSGKSLNIAPPGHEKHFDSLRDYFNTKYQWSRPDDQLLMQTTQEPNHIAKLNKQAKNILTSQELETLTKKQFCKAIDNYVQTLLKTQTVSDRADLVACITQLEGIDSIKQSKEFLTVTLNNGKKHRLKGDFYHEQFEIGSYSEHLRAAAESKPTATELTAALTDADQLRATYRAKRETYNRQHYAFAQSTADNNSPRIASKLDFERNRQYITPSNKNAHSELYGANRDTPSKIGEYRYFGNLKSEIEHRFIFNVNAIPTKADQQPTARHFNRQAELAEEHSNAGTTGYSEPKRTDREQSTDSNHGKVEYTESHAHPLGTDCPNSADSFNDFISRLSSQYKSQNNKVTTANDSTELTNDHESNQLLESKEIRREDRNRPIFNRAKRLIDSTKQLVSRAKQLIDSTSDFIKKHFDQLQRSRTEFTSQNQSSEYRERSTENGAVKDRAERLFGTVTEKISGKLEDPITNAIIKSIDSTGFKQRCQQLSKDRIKTNSSENWHTADRHRASTLENLAIESTKQLLRRFGDAKQADQYAWGNCRKINSVNQQLERLETKVSEIRLKPKPVTDFSYLRSDGYYPDYVIYHKEISEDQQTAFNKKNPLQLIDCISKKSENIEKYINQASKNIHLSDYEKFEKIIKNDRRMLKYLQCEKILEPQNDHLGQQRAAYLSCLKNFENIKSHIHEIRNPSQRASYASYEPDNNLKPKNDFDLGF